MRRFIAVLLSLVFCQAAQGQDDPPPIRPTERLVEAAKIEAKEAYLAAVRDMADRYSKDLTTASDDQIQEWAVSTKKQCYHYAMCKAKIEYLLKAVGITSGGVDHLLVELSTVLSIALKSMHEFSDRELRSFVRAAYFRAKKVDHIAKLCDDPRRMIGERPNNTPDEKREALLITGE